MPPTAQETVAREGAPPVSAARRQAACRFCGAPLHHSLVDLGMSPLCQTHITPEQLNHMEPFYPLHALVCGKCYLVQLEQFVGPDEIFGGEYAYFSSYADSWVAHARRYCELMETRFELNSRSRVVEIASNDGYLLQHFLPKKIPVLGIEPAANVARVAMDKGIPCEITFFGRDAAKRIVAKHGQADLLLGNNVLAHVPDLNDFVAGMKILLASSGVITMEFPHLYQLMKLNQFDTIYHEHFSYFSFYTVEQVFKAHGLTLFDVEEIQTHGGSLRIYARHSENPTRAVSPRVVDLRNREISEGFNTLERYRLFGEQVKETKRKLLDFLIRAKSAGKRIVGYGAPGKGNTLLNYCGIRTDFLDFTVDRNPYKQGKYTPGTHIPIRDPEALIAARPDYVLVLPWNLEEEIVTSMAVVRNWGGQFVIPIPSVRVV
jgi:hypothetical protein